LANRVSVISLALWEISDNHYFSQLSSQCELGCWRKWLGAFRAFW